MVEVSIDTDSAESLLLVLVTATTSELVVSEFVLEVVSEFATDCELSVTGVVGAPVSDVDVVVLTLLSPVLAVELAVESALPVVSAVDPDTVAPPDPALLITVVPAAEPA